MGGGIAAHGIVLYARLLNLASLTAAITISNFPFPVYHPIPQSGT